MWCERICDLDARGCCVVITVKMVAGKNAVFDLCVEGKCMCGVFFVKEVVAVAVRSSKQLAGSGGVPPLIPLPPSPLAEQRDRFGGNVIFAIHVNSPRGSHYYFPDYYCCNSCSCGVGTAALALQ